MQNLLLKRLFIVFVPGFLFFTAVNAQVASWSFNNILTGTGSANSTAGNASLGSTIAAGGAFNGGTVYYGEGPWPAGTIDLNAYLEFSITPSSGHTITISSLVMQIRRSTTGSSGAGPNSWSLRSSLDAYATDLSSGVLTSNSTPATVVSLGIAFMNMPAKITFRLYGYNATVSAGGLNRFVYDDIVANGSSVLPVMFDKFTVKAVNQSAFISCKLGTMGNLSVLNIERAADGINFEKIKQFGSELLDAESGFDFVDQLDRPVGTYAYRIQLITADGNVSYSSIQVISFRNENSFQIRAINTGAGNTARFIVNTESPGNCVFTLYNLSGNKIMVKSVQLAVGSQTLEMSDFSLKYGIYILTGENGKQTVSAKILIL